MLEFHLRLFAIGRLRQPHRREEAVTPDPDTLPHIIVHTPTQAEAALSAAQQEGQPIVLQSPPRCVLIQGAAWFRTLVTAARQAFPDVSAGSIIDCGDAPGLALAALRDGAEAVRVDAPPRALAAIEEIAGQLGARLSRRPPEALLDLYGVADPEDSCRRFLATGLE